MVGGHSRNFQTSIIITSHSRNFQASVIITLHDMADDMALRDYVMASLCTPRSRPACQLCLAACITCSVSAAMGGTAQLQHALHLHSLRW
jgi:hypothetical protein